MRLPAVRRLHLAQARHRTALRPARVRLPVTRTRRIETPQDLPLLHTTRRLMTGNSSTEPLPAWGLRVGLLCAFFPISETLFATTRRRLWFGRILHNPPHRDRTNDQGRHHPPRPKRSDQDRQIQRVQAQRDPRDDPRSPYGLTPAQRAITGVNVTFRRVSNVPRHKRQKDGNGSKGENGGNQSPTSPGGCWRLAPNHISCHAGNLTDRPTAGTSIRNEWGTNPNGWTDPIFLGRPHP